MRFIGNKELITQEITKLLEEQGLINKSLTLFNQNEEAIDKNLTLFDAFCGTGAVTEHLKEHYNIVANDLLNWCVIYSKGRASSKEVDFKGLGFNPFNFFNSNNEKVKGFFYTNYSPGGSDRMYFTPENAARIDYFRITIEEWKQSGLISDKEYSFLLASLIESVSVVANTAGVYGAFLKHWDPRAKKTIQFKKVDSRNTEHKDLKFLNKKAEDIIEDVECDILYIDPPYTQNQYGTQYHLLETLVLYDNPEISEVTGSRSTKPIRSDWSKNYKSHILLDEILGKTRANYVVFSYSKDGFMSKSYVEACLKRYGLSETYVCKKIDYNKYKNFKSRGKKDHHEYLFFVKMKDKNKIKYQSPLNFTGSKGRMVEEIKRHMPNKNFQTFIDAFGGGFNVGINMHSNKLIYNDNNYFLKDLIQSFRDYDTYQYVLFIKKIIKRFGLKATDSESYLKVRNYYNSFPKEERDPKLLYSVILYGYNQQLRFNSNHDFNNPVGMRWFNDKVLEKLISFSKRLKEIKPHFLSCDYTEIIDQIEGDTFVYLDPPYKFTRGAYNDGRRGFSGWNSRAEARFLEFVESLNKLGCWIMISYILEHKGEYNDYLDSWIRRNDFFLYELDPPPEIKRKEVLITNYNLSYVGNSTFSHKESVSEEA